MSAIRAKAGMPAVLIFSVVIIAAGTIIGYSNPVVFYTLIATAGLQLATAGIVKFIFHEENVRRFLWMQKS